jgi:hypothetical protein
MLLKVKPKAFIMAKVEITDAGIAKALMIVVRNFLRNMRTANIANNPP